MFTAVLVAVSLAGTAPAERVLTKADSGTTVTIAANEQLEIELSECRTCGYRWKTTAKPDPRVLTRRPQGRKDPACQPPSCIGGSSTTVFRYTGDGIGRTRIRLQYFGPGQSKASGTFRVTVRVR